MAHRVDTAAVESLVSRLQALTMHLHDQLSTLDQRLGSLPASWSGEAALQQEHARQQWQAGSQEMYAALSQLTSVATTALTNYSSALTANKAIWS